MKRVLFTDEGFMFEQHVFHPSSFRLALTAVLTKSNGG